MECWNAGIMGGVGNAPDAFVVTPQGVFFFSYRGRPVLKSWAGRPRHELMPLRAHYKQPRPSFHQSSIPLFHHSNGN